MKYYYHKRLVDGSLPLTLGGGILLTLPLLPLRSLAIAAMVNRLKDNDQADQI